MAQDASQFKKIAATNLAGVTAIQWSPPGEAASPNSAEAIAGELLAGALSQGNAGVNALHQRLLNVKGSPDYIFQTNIENLPIDPGDEVFCGVHYQAGKGFVMFGNVDKGHYFSIQLDPPPGATFNGNSVEWIVEAPNTGKPGTSLPGFTPVTFTAMGSNAAGTVAADPSAGDSTNIVAFGRSLTSVTLSTDALTVNSWTPVSFRSRARPSLTAPSSGSRRSPVHRATSTCS